MENLKEVKPAKKRTTKRKIKSKSTSALPSKKENYNVSSKSSLLKDFKNSAIHGISTVKRQFNSFSSILKPANKSKSNLQAYCEITNMPTPVKMYSPFTIESPAPLSQEERDKLRQRLFTSPTNKFQDDFTKMEQGVNELNLISTKIEQQLRSKNPFLTKNLLFEDDGSLI